VEELIDDDEDNMPNEEEKVIGESDDTVVG